MLRSIVVALCVALVAQLWAVTASASDASLAGRVSDRLTGAPLADVCVKLGPAAPRCATTTDASGNYFIDLSGAPNGVQWELLFQKPPYQDGRDFATVNGPTILNFTMVSPGCVALRTDTPTQTVYLPNITKTLGGPAGWVTPFIVQNTGAIVTTLEVSFYRFSDGSCIARRSVSNLGAGKSFADIPNNDNDLPGDTQFSVVVRSFGAPIVSTVNQVQGSGAAFQALAYAGTSTGAITVYLPNVTRRFYGWDIPFIIQNLGTTTTTATSTFTSIASPTCTTAHTFAKPLTIDAGRSKVIDPDFESAYSGIAGSGLINGCQYSVVVAASQPLAVVANAHNESGAPAAYSHNALASGSSILYAPYAALGGPGGRFSPIVVQNVGTSVANATLEFTPLGGGVAKSFTLSSVAARASRAFDPRYSNGDTTQALCTAPSTSCLGNGEYSIRISSTGLVAAVVLPVTGTTAAAYTAALQGQAKSYLPNVTRTLGGANGWTTPIVVQSTSATALRLTWCPFNGGACTIQNLLITPLTAQWIDPRNVVGLSEDTQYAVLADGGGTGNITAIVYERNTTGGDGDMVYEGFPAP